MITDTIELLKSNPFYGVSELVEVAKGSYEPLTFKNMFRKVIRKIKYKK